MSGTVARSLGALGDALGGTANVNFDSNTLFIDGTNNRVGIGIAAPGTSLDVRFAANPPTDNGVGVDALRVYTTVAQAAGVGGAISLGGLTDTGSPNAAGYGQIAGRKENSTSANYAGFLSFATNGSGGTMSERMRIDSGGRITTPAQPAFYAFRNDGSYTPGGGVVIPWNNTFYNIGSHYNTSNGRFTAPVAGLYYFHYQQYFRSNYTGRCAIWRNNASAGLMHVGRGSVSGIGEWTHSVSLIINCAANDFVDCRTDAGTTGELFVTADHSWFMGFLIG